MEIAPSLEDALGSLLLYVSIQLQINSEEEKSGFLITVGKVGSLRVKGNTGRADSTQSSISVLTGSCKGGN